MLKCKWKLSQQKSPTQAWGKHVNCNIKKLKSVLKVSVLLSKYHHYDSFYNY